MTAEATLIEDAVRATTTVPTTQERAFTIFTVGMGVWWPAANTFARDEFDTVAIEPEAGGRWFERTKKGPETDWGRVLAWEPPHRLVLSWQIAPTGRPEPDPKRASEVEVRFEPEGEFATRVELEHRAFERHGPEGAAIWREAMASEGGWPLFLARYAATFG